jgi:CheY-like chemotaxis protein
MKKRYILWADDDPDDLSLIKDILQKNNRDYDIVEAANGKQALSCLQQAKEEDNLPCLVILDINMPVMDGKQTLATIKRTEAFQELPVVVFTTSSSELDKHFCNSFNVEMITKPPSYHRLEHSVLRLLSFCA